MSTISHEPSTAVPEPRSWSAELLLRDMWASLAIAVMWLAVLCDAIWGPNFVSTSSTSATTIPSAVFLALFAWLATRAVAKYGFSRRDTDPD